MAPKPAKSIVRIEMNPSRMAEWLVEARPTFRRAGLSLRTCTRYVSAFGVRVVVHVAVSAPPISVPVVGRAAE